MPENAHEGITIEFRGDSVSFDNTVNAMNHAIRALRKDITGFNKELKFNPNNLDVLKKKFQDYNNAITATNAKLEYLKRDLADCVDENGKVTDEKQWLRMQAEITDTTGELLKLEDAAKKVKLRIDNINAYKMADQFEKVGKTLDNAGKNMENLGRTLMPVSTVAAAGLGGAAKAAMDFESALAGVYKTVDETPTTTYKDIEDWIRTMATELPATAAEIANVAEVAGQLGITADSLQPFVRTMIDLGNATNITATEGAAAVAQFFNIMGYSANDVKDDVDNFGAALTALGNNAATDEESIVYMAKALAAAGHQVGLSTQEVLGLSTTLSSLGLSAERGGSAISTIFRKIETDAKTFSDAGSKRLAAWGELLGMTGEEFRKAWNTDTINTIEKVIIGLGKTEDISKSLYEVLGDVDISNIRQIDTITRLANSEGMLSKYIAMANEEWDKNTALTKEAERRYGTTQSQLQILKNNVTEVGISLGETLLPIINDLIDSAKPLINSLRRFSKENGEAVTGVLAFVSAMSPALLVLGKGAKLIGGLSTAVAKYTKLGIEAEGTTQLLAKVLGGASKFGLAVAVGAAAVGLGALVVAFIRSRDETLKFKKSINSLSSALNDNINQSAEVYRQREYEIDSASYYIEKLESLTASYESLNDKEVEGEGIKQEMVQTVATLNQLLGEEAYAVDEDTGVITFHGEKVDDLAGSYNNLAEAMKRQAWLDANYDAYTDSIKKQSEYMTELEEAAGRYSERLTNIDFRGMKASEEFVNAMIDYLDGKDVTIQDLQRIIESDSDMMNTLKDIGEDSYSAVQGFLKDAERAQRDYNKEVEITSEKVLEAMSFQEMYEAVLNGTPEQMQGILASFDQFTKKLEGNETQLRLMRDALIRTREEFNRKGINTQQYDQAIKKIDEMIGRSNAAARQQNANWVENANTQIREAIRGSDGMMNAINAGFNALGGSGSALWNRFYDEAVGAANRAKWYIDGLRFNDKFINVYENYIPQGTSKGGAAGRYAAVAGSGGYASGGYHITIAPQINVTGTANAAMAKSLSMQMVSILDQELGKRLRK